MTNREYRVGVVGATGAVGLQIIKYLEQRAFPVSKLIPLSSARSSGSTIQFKGKNITVQELTPDIFEEIDIAFFSAGGSVSKNYAPEAVKRNVVVIDNSNAFRMEKEVPLVVPEVNRQAIFGHKGIIANPNCSTIQMVVALKPIYDQLGINRIIVSTYQAVSGAGLQAVRELEHQIQSHMKGEEAAAQLLPVKSLPTHYPIAYNAIPQVDVATENGFTLEEMKMVQETRKILDDDKIGVTATCVRIPVLQCHSESVYIETKSDFDLVEVRQLLSSAPGIILQDDINHQIYPMPLQATDRPEVFVGRLRKDLTYSRGLNMWIVSDSLLKGAAINAIQIAECLVEEEGLT